MILVVPTYDLVLLFESTSLSTLADAETGRVTCGVQIASFRDRVQTYLGDIAVRALVTLRTPAMLDALTQFRQEVRHRPYERRILELLYAVAQWSPGEDLSSFFCSELVVEAYHRMGLLPSAVPCDTYAPADFSTETHRVSASLQHGAQLGPEQVIARI